MTFIINVNNLKDRGEMEFGFKVKDWRVINGGGGGEIIARALKKPRMMMQIIPLVIELHNH